MAGGGGGGHGAAAPHGLLLDHRASRFDPGRLSDLGEGEIGVEDGPECEPGCGWLATLRRRTWQLFEDPRSSVAATVVGTFLIACILVSSAAFVVESVDVPETAERCSVLTMSKALTLAWSSMSSNSETRA